MRAIRELATNYASALDAIERDLLKVYEKYAENGVLTNAEMTKYNRLTSLRAQLVGEIKPLMLENARLTEKLARVQYEEAFYRYAWSIDQAVGVKLRWGLLNPETVKAASASALREISLRDLPARAWNRIDRAITQGLIRGVSMPQMMRDVRAATDLSKFDAMRIVRTEAHLARERGNFRVSEIAVERGVILKRMWVASLDDRTRSSHAGLDGVKVDPGEMFPGGAMYPGGFGRPEEDINCRCTVVDVIEGLEPELRRTDTGVEPYTTFGDWAQARGIRGSRYGQRYNFTRR